MDIKDKTKRRDIVHDIQLRNYKGENDRTA